MYFFFSKDCLRHFYLFVLNFDIKSVVLAEKSIVLGNFWYTFE